MVDAIFPLVSLLLCVTLCLGFAFRRPSNRVLEEVQFIGEFTLLSTLALGFFMRRSLLYLSTSRRLCE